MIRSFPLIGRIFLVTLLVCPLGASLAQESSLSQLMSTLVKKNKRGSVIKLQEALESLVSIRDSGEYSHPIRLLSELEEIDSRMRLGQVAQIENRLNQLALQWKDVPSIRERAFALKKLHQVRKAVLIEPNAISSSDVGAYFREKFLPAKRVTKFLTSSGPRKVPLNFPIRYLSGLSEGVLSSKKPEEPLATVIGFVDFDSLMDPKLDYQGKINDLLTRNQRVVLGLFIYFRGERSTAVLDVDSRPWNRMAIFWINGSFKKLEGVPWRTRYEWLPGPAFFMIEFSGKILSWCFPWDSWMGFQRDVEGWLENSLVERKS